MDFTNQIEGGFEAKAVSSTNEHIVIEAEKVSSSVLQRLMQEVKNDQANGVHAYDRTHNRHNR